MSRIIAVLGSTGLQGGAVLDALLAGGWSVRALTRNVDSAAAKALAARGLDVRRADLSDSASLVKAFEGSYGVFLVTDTHACGGDAELEFNQGKNAVDAAKQVGVKHLVFSSLEDPRVAMPANVPFSSPGRKVAVMEVKSEISVYSDKNGPPTTHLVTSAYYENYLRWYNFQKLPDGTYRLGTNIGTNAFAQNSIGDIAASAAEAFKQGAQLYGKYVPVVSEDISMPDVLAVIGEITGTNIAYHFVSDEAMRALPFGWATDVSNMYQYFREGGYQAARPKKNRIIPGTPFRAWAEANKEGLVQRLGQATDSDEPFNPGH